MSQEPMFNIREKAPLVLLGILVIAHILRLIIPQQLLTLLQPWLYLLPLKTDGISIAQNVSSLFGHGFLHGDFMHLLMNGFMIIAFGVVTLQGLRADLRLTPHILTPVQKFYIIFSLGVIGGGLFQWGWWAFTETFAIAIGASGGASALFATMANAIGGRDRMLKFGLGWLVINIIMALIGPTLGVNIAWAAHLGGYAIGMILARYWVRPNSTSFKLN